VYISGAGLEKSSCLLPYLLHSSLGANLVVFERHFYDTVYLAGFLVNLVVNAEYTLLLYNADGVIHSRLLKVDDFWLCNSKPADLVALYSLNL